MRLLIGLDKKYSRFYCFSILKFLDGVMVSVFYIDVDRLL